MHNNDPVFRSVGQALYVAFAVEIQPMCTKGATQILIEDLLRQRYGEEKVPASERTINMGGLSPIEFRGQCAMIRSTVKTQLTGVEADSIYARFGHQMTRANGVRALRDYCASLCNTKNDEAILALLWAIYAPRRKRTVRYRGGDNGEWSLRAIEKQYGGNKSTLGRDQKVLRTMCQGLELRAQNTLAEHYERTGLIGEWAND